MFTGGLTAAAGGFWFLFVVFQESLGWGVACIIIPNDFSEISSRQPTSIFAKIMTSSKETNMRVLVSTAAILIFCTGCGRMGSVNNTTFFSTHDAQAHLETEAKVKGYEVGGSGAGSSLGGSTAEKHFNISIKGDQPTRDALLSDYKDSVENKLNNSGVTINGRGVSGEVSGFDFNYHQSGVIGIIRVNSVIDANGYIQIDIFMYEHQ